MVLRKPPPPGIDVPPRGSGPPYARSATSRSSGSSHSSSKRGGHSSFARKDSWELDEDEPIYSADLNTSPAFDLMPLEQAQKSPVTATAPDAPNPWDDELVERPDSSQLPLSLQAGAAPQSQESTKDDSENSKPGISRIPQILVAGTARRQAAEESHRSLGSEGSEQDTDWLAGPSPRLQSNNPFLRAKKSNSNPWDSGDQPSQPQTPSERAAWAPGGPQESSIDRISQTSGFIPMTARLSLLDQPEDPWAQRSDQSGTQTPLRPAETAVQHTSGPSELSSTAWQASTSAGPTNPTVFWPSQADQEMDSNNQWEEVRPPGPAAGLNEDPFLATLSEQQHGNYTLSHSTAAPSQNLIDLEDTPENATLPLTQPSVPPKDDTQPPSVTPLPPLSEAELRKFQEKQAETYAIRHINWTDSTGTLRESPVLVQNKNGPCPLLALVNGLIMLSNQDAQSPVVKALQIRENISLGLLIQALFDELTTWHAADEELPDIEALSRFLTILHTGMNVNPRLTLESPSSAGKFLETNDLRFYGTFKVPLVHGWIAAPSTEAHAAMTRVAQYHEDIQLLQFRKEEIEDRVVQSGSDLSADEQTLIRDIDTIDRFVHVENATQLSAFGLEHLSSVLAPGSISILFRNDHFSTLYKHPQSHQLFTLITDAGYADHAEIVWESLTDVNGMESEFFAGDFRPVGHAPSTSESSNPAGQRTTSLHRAGHAAAESSNAASTEQTDADYAYALSLQFQEEAAQRDTNTAAAHARQSSDPLQASRSVGTSVTHNRSSSSNVVGGGNNSSTGNARNTQSSDRRRRQTSDFPTDGRPSIPPRTTSNIPRGGANDTNDGDDGDDGPPPSYEQVARNKAAELQRGRAAALQPPQPDFFTPSSPLDDPSGRSGQYPLYHQYPGSSAAAAGLGRRGQPQPWATSPTSRVDRRNGRDKDCVVM